MPLKGCLKLFAPYEHNTSVIKRRLIILAYTTSEICLLVIISMVSIFGTRLLASISELKRDLNKLELEQKNLDKRIKELERNIDEAESLIT